MGKYFEAVHYRRVIIYVRTAHYCVSNHGEDLSFIFYVCMLEMSEKKVYIVYHVYYVRKKTLRVTRLKGRRRRRVFMVCMFLWLKLLVMAR